MTPRLPTRSTAHAPAATGHRAFDVLRGRGRAATLLISALTAILTAVLVLAGERPGLGQTLAASAQVEVPVLGDNLDRAKTRAIHEAQVQCLEKALEALVAPEWRTAYDRELKRHILPRLDRYLSSFRTTRAEPSTDRTRYVAAITAELARVPLAEDLREMQLPVLGDPKRGLRVLVAENDPILSDPQLRQDVLAPLQARLELLNFQVSGTTAVTREQAALLHEPGDVPRRTEFLKRLRAEADLFLQFRPGVPGAAVAPARDTTVSAILFHGELGGILGTFDSHAPGAPPARPRDFVTGLAGALAAQLQPTSIQPFSAFAAAAALLDLRIVGLRSIAEEEAFGAAFFRRSSPFARFTLARIETGAVVYRGTYAANRQSAERELQGRAFGQFRVTQVNWIDTTLELLVQNTAAAEHRELDLFPPDGRQANVQDTLQAFLSRDNTPDLGDPVYAEHEDNGWLDRANALAFNAPIYGVVDARADSDFYVAEALADGETVEIVWARLERTNLLPVLRLYDEHGQPVRTVVPRLLSRISYKVPEGQHTFYLEVADRFGFIQGESGGYLKFPYLLTVRRQSPR